MPLATVFLRNSRRATAATSFVLAAGLLAVPGASAQVSGSLPLGMPSGQVALDRFERSVIGALGSADSGAAWSVTDPSSTSVSAGRAHLALRTPGQGIAAYLASPPSVDTDAVLSVSLDTAATGGGVWFSLVGRRVGPAEYRARIKLASTGAVTASLVRTVQGVETVLGVSPVAVTSYVPGSALQVRMRLRGTAPTTLATKVWALGASEPAAWQVKATDAAAGLQSAGSLGLFAYLSGSADRGGSGVTVDDLDVRTPMVSVGTAATTLRTARTAGEPYVFSSNIPVNTYVCSIDAGTWAPCTSPYSPPLVNDGVHQLSVRAEDSDGYTSPATTTSWLLDTVAPVVSVLSGPAPASTVAASTATVDVSTDEPANLECNLDVAGWAVCGTVISLSSLAEGQHTLDLRASDAAGNVSVPVSRRWTVDTVAPQTTFTSGAMSSPTTSTTATFGLAASESATFSCRIDAAAWAPCTSPVSFSNLAVGTHTAQVAARDAAGNIDATPATTSWTVSAPVTLARSGVVQPGAGNTGVPAGTALTPYWGDLTITTPGTVIDGLDVHGFVTVRANDVTIRRSIVRGGVASITAGNRSLITSTYPGVVIEDTELAPEFPSVRIDGLKGYGFTARRLNIHDAVDNTLVWGDNTTLSSSWLHDNRHYLTDPNQNGGPSHDDSVQVQGGTNITISGNTITGAYGAAIQVTQDYALTTSLAITSNWMGNGGCTVNVAEKGRGPLQNLVMSANTFYRTSTYNCPAIIPQTTMITNTANTYPDGTPITLIRN